MDYKQMRSTIDQLMNNEYENFIKTVISFEKGINDKHALDEIYKKYIDSNLAGFLGKNFDYFIDDLRKQGKNQDFPFVKEEKDNLINTVGNLVEDVEVLNKKTKDRTPFTVVNFTVLSSKEGGLKVYSNCSAYGNKSDVPKDFKKGDFVKIFGKTSMTMERNIPMSIFYLQSF